MGEVIQWLMLYQLPIGFLQSSPPELAVVGLRGTLCGTKHAKLIQLLSIQLITVSPSGAKDITAQLYELNYETLGILSYHNW